jgi:hypothetical protein
MIQSGTQSGNNTLNPVHAFESWNTLNPLQAPIQVNALDSWKKVWPKIVARAWSDEAFMQRLMQNPQEIAWEYKLPLIAGMAYKVVSGNEPPTMVLSVPPKPSSLKIESMEELADQAEQKNCSIASCL